MRVRIDFDIKAENYDAMKSEIEKIFDGSGLANVVIQSPLSQEDFESKGEREAA